MRIAHCADIQIRFGERHEEFREVFERFYEDLREQKPDRIYVGGDLMHHKIKLSPHSFSLLVSFLTELAKIAPTDVILGNHDLNMQNLDQGDVMFPIVDFARSMGIDNAIVEVTEDNVQDIDFWQNLIYYYPNSGFYDVGRDLVYGVFSCKDNEIIKLENPIEDKTYVALWHGTIYGAIGDNGYELPADEAFNLETFKNFDCVMMGDIHEYQTFRDDETIAYCGSLIQNNFGESIDKGYLLWEMDELVHQRRIIINDWGFAKLNITRGETIEERIENLQFSNDRKKTKVRVIYEDYAENYSLERERRIRDLIRTKYGCKEITVIFESLDKEEVDIFEEGEEVDENLGMIELLKEWIEVSENDADDEQREELLNLATTIDEELEINERAETKNRTSIVPLKLTISNIFSFPEKRMTIDFEKFQGAMGIFGRNYSGKSNFIRAFVWSAFEVVPSNKDSNTIVNVYTKSPKGYTILEVLINGVKHRITRQIEQKARGSNSYKRKFEKLIEYDEGGETKQKWQAVKSDKDTTEQKEVKRQIEEAIGSYEDFSINSLHIHGSEDDYINLGQQDKNTLFWKYNGLEPFKRRRDYARKKINIFKKDHANLGKAAEIEDGLKLREQELKAKEITLASLEKEKGMNQTRRDDEQKKILELTKKIKEVQVLPFNSKEDIQKKIDEKQKVLDAAIPVHDDLKKWLDENDRKELSFEADGLSLESLEKSIADVEKILQSAKEGKQEAQTWIDANPEQEVPDDSSAMEVINQAQADIIRLQDDLIIYQGKPCPTCGSATEKPNKDEENKTKTLIAEKKVVVDSKNKLIQAARDARNHNDEVRKRQSTLQGFKNNIKLCEEQLKNRKKNLEMFIKSQGVIEHNKVYDAKKKDFGKVQSDIQNLNNTITVFQAQFDAWDENEKIKKENTEHERYIQDIQESIDQYQIALNAVDRQIREVVGEISVIESNIQTDEGLLDKIREADRSFKIYRLYLEAVERDGIPSMIINRRLPLINSRINSMISHIAKFKVSLEVDKKGDIKEYFYFMEDKRDKLPVAGSGSGAQKFLISLAIKDGLRYVSGRFVVQPSILLIDEGFGTLHQEAMSEMINILNYLKSKYRNLVIITHVDEIKDSADFVFEATKDRTMISEEDLDQNENAGITVFTKK